MNFSKEHYTAFVLTLLVFSGNTAEGQLFSDESSDESFIWRDAPLNDETIYKQIQGVELRAHSTFMRHPYEVIIPNTDFGTFIFCQLFDANGDVVIGSFENAGRGETRVFFAIREPVTSAVCVDARAPKVDGSSS